MKPSQRVEDYLKYIYVLSKTQEVRGADLAEIMGISRPTVSVALKNMENEGYITMNGGRVISLTERGRRIARQTHERHMVFRTLLTRLGVDAEIAREDACHLEHAVSEESYQALSRLLRQRFPSEKNADLDEKRDLDDQ